MIQYEANPDWYGRREWCGMKRAILTLGLFLSAVAWPDSVYFDNGRVWQGVEVLDAKQRLSGASVLIEPTTATKPVTV